MEGLIFGGAYPRREICTSKSIGLAIQLEVNLPFLLCFTLHLRAIFQIQAPGRLIFGGGFNGGFSALPDWGGYIWRGLYMEGLIFGNFTVSHMLLTVMVAYKSHSCYRLALVTDTFAD